MNNWFEIGIIVKPQGIAGEMRVLPTTDDPERFGLLKEVLVRFPKGQDETYKIVSTRLHKGLVLLKLEGITDRNAAEKMTRGVLLIPPEQAIPLNADEYFIRDLIGLTVQTESGEAIGTIKDVFPTGANDVYTVQNEDGKTFMIPAIKDVVRAVSMESRTMTVRLLDGLLELTT